MNIQKVNSKQKVSKLFVSDNYVWKNFINCRPMAFMFAVACIISVMRNERNADISPFIKKKKMAKNLTLYRACYARHLRAVTAGAAAF